MEAPWSGLSFDANEEMNRRKLLAVLGSTIGGALTVNTVAGHGGDGGGPPIEDFYVEGRRILIRRDYEDYWEETRRTVSPDLERRYGDPVVESTRRWEKSRHQKQVEPSSAEYRLENDSFSANMAKEDEWREYFLARREERYGGTVAAMAGGIPALDVGGGVESYPELSQHDPDDDLYPYAVWTYSEDNGTYTRGSPVNVIYPFEDEPSECKTIDGVKDEFINAGWTDDVAEYERFAWNRVSETFESNQNPDLNNGTVAESWGRSNGGYHMRMWTFAEEEGDFSADDYHGRYLCGQAHHDSRTPHTATGYECAKHEVESIFEDAFNWYVYPDYFFLDNEKGDGIDDCSTSTAGDPWHNGYASAITWTECSNVGAQSTDHHHEEPASGC